MVLRLLHYSDLENAYDDPTRIGCLAGLLDARRDERTLVVGTGDNTAPGVLALETEGRHALAFFDAVSPDAETFGNHDFDFGPATTRRIVADSPQPWLSANVYEPDGERRFADVAPGLVIERDGTSVGLLGLTDPKTPTMCPPAADLVLADPVEAARETVADRLRAKMDATGLSEVVATAPDPLVRDRERRYGGECRVGNLVADAYRFATDADVAFTSTGGLRDGPPLVGEVTVADLVGLSPFAGALKTAEVRGDDLRALVERAATPPEGVEGKRWFGHLSGLDVVWDREAMALVELRHAGAPVDPGATYTLATNGFVVETESFPAPTPDDVVADHGVQYDAVVAYARECGLDVELDGRLRDV